MELSYCVHFAGCDCGCTESKTFYIYGDNFQEMKMVMARIFFGYISYRSPDPFYRVGFDRITPTFISSEQIDEVKSLAKQLDDWNKIISDKKSQISNLKSSIKSFHYHARCLEIEVPEKKVLQIKKYEQDIVNLKSELKSAVFEANNEFQVSRNIKVNFLKHDEDADKSYEEPFEFQNDLFNESLVSVEDLYSE